DADDTFEDEHGLAAGWAGTGEGGTRVHDVDENRPAAAPDLEGDTAPAEEPPPDTEDERAASPDEGAGTDDDPPTVTRAEGDPASDDDPAVPGTSASDLDRDADGTEAHRAELRAVESQIDALRKSFDSRAAAYEDTIRSLQATIEELRGQQLTGMMKPTFQQFADLKAELDAAAQRARDSSADHHADEYEFFSGSVDDIMAHFDLDSVRATAADPFDRRSTAAVLRTPTAGLARATSSPRSTTPARAPSTPSWTTSTSTRCVRRSAPPATAERTPRCSGSPPTIHSWIAPSHALLDRDSESSASRESSSRH